MGSKYYKKPLCTNFDFMTWCSKSSIRKAPLLKSKWEPFLSDYLTRISDAISLDTDFYPEEVSANSNFINFFMRRDAFGQDPRHSAVVLKGSVGIGKTSFINWWERQDGRSHLCAKIDINHHPLHALSGALSDTAHNLQKKLAADLTQKLFKSHEFNKAFRGKIAYVKSAAFADTYENFDRCFVNQSDDFISDFPSLGPCVLLSCIIMAVNECFKSPVWLTIDNVDLEKPEMQYDYIRSAFSTYEDVKRYILDLQVEPEFHVIVTARPETCKSWQKYFNNFQDIEYIHPDVLSIAKKRLHKAIKSSSLNTNVQMPSITISGKNIPNSSVLADHISRCIDSSLSPARWPWGDDPNNFHISLVNLNVRRFINSWVHYILSGNFINLWAFPEDDTKKLPSPYTYLLSIIKGPFNNFSGNDSIDGSGESSDSPLFFNIYGLTLPGFSHVLFTKNYFIYLRILQYLYLLDKGINFGRLISALSPFFDRTTLINSVKFLLWTRMIDETTTGARNIGGYSNYEAIVIEEASVIKSNAATKLYVKYLVYDYTYVSSMSLVSVQLTNEYNTNQTIYNESERRHRATLAFLHSHLNILLCNLRDYKANNLLKDFTDLFVAKGENIRPWLNSVNAAIATSKSVLQYLRDKNDRDYSKEIRQTEDLLVKYKELKNTGINKIKNYVEDIYE